MNLQLTPEQRVAFDSLKAAQTPPIKTDDDFIIAVMLGIINGEAKRLFDVAVQRLSDGVSSLSYESRLALIAQVESSIPQ